MARATPFSEGQHKTEIITQQKMMTSEVSFAYQDVPGTHYNRRPLKTHDVFHLGPAATKSDRPSVVQPSCRDLVKKLLSLGTMQRAHVWNSSKCLGVKHQDVGSQGVGAGIDRIFGTVPPNLRCSADLSDFV